MSQHFHHPFTMCTKQRDVHLHERGIARSIDDMRHIIMYSKRSTQYVFSFDLHYIIVTYYPSRQEHHCYCLRNTDSG
jgi:hypothetical protein